MQQALPIPFGWRSRGFDVIHVFGRNNDLDDADGEVLVWDSGVTYQYQTSAVALEAVSASANDTAAGTGARTIRVFGLDENYLLQQEDVTLNGTTAVALVNTYRRIYRAIVLSTGSGEENDGAIAIRLSGAGATQLQIADAENTTLFCAFTAPEEYDTYLVQWDAKVDAGAAQEVVVRYKTRDVLAGQPFLSRGIRSVNRDDGYTILFPYPVYMPPGTDIAITADSTSDNVRVSTQMQFILVPKG